MAINVLKGDARARLRPCLRCGYSLRHNIDARNCPECGLAVRISLRDDRTLEWSNPAWVRKMATASAMLLLASIGLVASLLLIQAGYWSVRHRRSNVPFMVVNPWEQWIQIVVGASVVLQCGAGFLLATNEHRHPDTTRGRRIALRITASISLAIAGGAVALQILRPYSVVHWGDWLVAAAPIALALVQLYCLYELCRRLPNGRAMKFIRSLAYMLAIGYVVLLLRGYRDWLFVYMIRLPWSYEISLWTVGSMVYFSLTCPVLAYCWLEFRSAAREADKNWVTDPEPVGV